MAGIKGRSGGARPGAGRPKRQPERRTYPCAGDPVEILQFIMNDDTVDLRLRIEAAKALLPYFHAKANVRFKYQTLQPFVLNSRFQPSTAPVLPFKKKHAD